MNRKPLIPIVLVLAAGVGIYFWSHRGHAAESDAADENTTPTVVTVQTAPVRTATLHAYVTGYGSLEPAPSTTGQSAATARVAPAVPGVVKHVHAVEGTQVAAGAPLVDLDDRAAVVAVRSAREAADRQKKLYAENNTSQKNLQDAQAQLATAEAQLSLLHIPAPLSGTVTRVNVRPGEAVDLTTVLAEITDLDRLVVSVDIPSADAGELKPGQRLDVLGATPVNTTVAYVSPAVDPATDAVTVRAAIPADAGLRAGTAVAVRIVVAEHGNCLAAPAESVVENADGQAVVSVVKNDEATEVPVKVGIEDGPLTEITGGGVKPGDTVVTKGAYGLPAKTKVQVAKPAVTAER